MTQPVMQAAKGRLCGGGLAGVARIGGQCRAVWNLFLAETADRHKVEGKLVFPRAGFRSDFPRAGFRSDAEMSARLYQSR